MAYRSPKSQNLLAGAPTPANDLPAALPHSARCPTCGQRLDGFTLRGSQLLDMVHLAQDVLSDLQAAIEAEVLP